MCIRLMKKILFLLFCLPIHLCAQTDRTKIFQLLTVADGIYTDAASELASSYYTECVLIDEERMKLMGCYIKGSTKTFLFAIDEKTERCYKLYGFRVSDLHSLLIDMVDCSVSRNRQDALESLTYELLLSDVPQSENITETMLAQYNNLSHKIKETDNIRTSNVYAP